MIEKKNGNRILDTAFGLFDAIAPSVLSDPEKALRKLVKSMGWIQIEKKGKVSVDQLKLLQELDLFEGKNLIQIKRTIESESPKIGPITKKIAKLLTIPILRRAGLGAEFVPLTPEEQVEQLNDIDNPPDYFKTHEHSA